MAFVRDSMQSWMDIVKQRSSAKNGLHVKTGLPPLDKALSGGWSRQNVTYLLGDSGKGKSWLAAWMFLAALEQLELKGAPPPTVKQDYVKPPVVVFWSMEMGLLTLASRMIVQLADKLRNEQVDYRVLSDGAVCRVGDSKGTVYGEEEQHALNQAVNVALETLTKGQGELGYLEFEATRIGDFRETLNDLDKTHDIVLVIIDQFARMESEFPADSMSEGQGEKTDALRSLARDYDCHVLSVLNINRQGQQAGHVRASHIWGGIHAQYDADILLILEWDEDYTERNQIPDEVIVSITLAKNRMGTEGKVQVFFNRPTGMFTLSRADEEGA